MTTYCDGATEIKGITADKYNGKLLQAK